MIRRPTYGDSVDQSLATAYRSMRLQGVEPEDALNRLARWTTLPLAHVRTIVGRTVRLSN